MKNLQHLLGLTIFDKTRLVTFHLKYNKENTLTGFYQREKSESTHDLDLIHCVLLTMTTIAKRLLQINDAKHQCLNVAE